MDAHFDATLSALTAGTNARYGSFVTTRIYLDHLNGSPVRPSAIAAMRRAAATAGNPSSLHAIGRLARRELELAASAVRTLIATPRANVVFTGSGVEANDLGILGIARKRQRKRVLVAYDESSSVIATTQQLIREGFSVEPLSDARLDDDVALIVMAIDQASSGRVNPTQAIAATAERFGVPMHVDATRAARTYPIDLVGVGATTLALASEPLGGPRGAGALVTQKGLELEPLWRGGGQEGGARSGSQAVMMIAGFGAALDDTRHERNHNSNALDTIWGTLGAHLLTGERIPGVSALALPAAKADMLVRLASDQGVMLGRVPGGICASAGWCTSDEDLVAATRALARCAPDLQKAA